MERYARIIGTGLYLPETEISNAHMAERINQAAPGLGDVVFKFEESSRIMKRYYAPRDWATSDLAAKAAMAALEDAGVAP